MPKRKDLYDLIDEIEALEDEDDIFLEDVPNEKGKKSVRKRLGCPKCGSAAWFKASFDPKGKMVQCSDCPDGKGRH